MPADEAPGERPNETSTQLTFPSLEDVVRRLEKLKADGYSRDARLTVSDWATPYMVNFELDEVDPAALGDAVFLLGAADLPGDSSYPIIDHLYGPADFEAALAALRPFEST